MDETLMAEVAGELQNRLAQTVAQYEGTLAVERTQHRREVAALQARIQELETGSGETNTSDVVSEEA